MRSNGRSNVFKFQPVPRTITPHHAQLIASELKDRNVADVRWWLMIKPRLVQQLTHVLFPGYIANEAQEKWIQRLDRNGQLKKIFPPRNASVEKSEQGIQFAYEQLPRSDFIQDREEVLQIKLDAGMVATYTPADLRSVLIKGKLRPQVQIYAYIWRYDCRSVDPDNLESIRIGDKSCSLSDISQTVFKKGGHHMNITDCLPWAIIRGKAPDDGSQCTISLQLKHDADQPMYISLCSVYRKTASQLAAGLIMQDVCHCINQSYAKHKQDTLYKLPKVYTILGLGDAVTANELDDARQKYNTTIGVLGHDCLDHSATDDDSDNADICMVGDEVVSLRDPVTLVRIGIPGKGIHCMHSGCFDIETFLQFHEHATEWKCPHCFDKITGVQDICISGTFLQYLNQFPEEDRIVKRSDGTVHKSMVSNQTRKRTIETNHVEEYNPNKFRVIECGDDDRDNSKTPESTEIVTATKLSTTWRVPLDTVDILELD
ncbi:hypothetical protein INT44_008990 [Umbelopsis vinacea]|uniref:SP-RING-type domain-containing protein n=1 Tax=Umbelopsis vinacea TaxID=44442 RepID=A0A8H7Q2T5_9FUNG|nr:hypothetical protein INT44_008990 [Umbelopsis vinacea]